MRRPPVRHAPDTMNWTIQAPYLIDEGGGDDWSTYPYCSLRGFTKAQPQMLYQSRLKINCGEWANGHPERPYTTPIFPSFSLLSKVPAHSTVEARKELGAKSYLVVHLLP